MAAQLILVEAYPRNAADGTTRTVRLAGGGAQYPYYYDGLHWMAGIDAAPTIITSLSFDATDIGTGGVPQAAEISWAACSAADLADLAGLVWFDAPITVRIGPEGALPPVALAGKVLSTTVDAGKLKIALADPATALKVPLLTARWAGTGGINGPADWDGTIKRRIWGRVWNVQGQAIEAATNIYNFADPAHPLSAIMAVRDKGASASALTVLGWQGDAISTFAALQAAVCPAGGGVVCPSIACVKWWTTPAGDLTADIHGEIGAGYVETAAQIAERLVAEVGGPAFAAGTIASAAADRQAPVGWIATDESTQVSAMLDELLGASSIAWVLNPTGEIVLRRWAWSAPVLSITSEDVSRKASYRPVATRKLGYRRNEHVQQRSSLAGVVLVEDVQFGDGTTIGEVIGDITAKAKAASDAAASALAEADNAKAVLADIASDNVLTPGEKASVVMDYNIIVAERQGILGQAATFGITGPLDDYNAAYAALIAYLDTLTTPYLWSNITGNTAIEGPTFRNKFEALYTTRQALLNAIATAAGGTATWAGISGAGKPQDGATVGAPSGTSVGGTTADAVADAVTQILPTLSMAIQAAQADLAAIQDDMDGAVLSAQSAIDQITAEVARAQGAEGTLTSQITNLTANYNGLSAAVSAEALARNNADGAITATISSQQSQIDNAVASITSHGFTLATLQTQATSFEQRLTAGEATAQTQALAIADASGKLQGYLALSTSVGAANASVRLMASSNGGQTYNSSVALEATEVVVVNDDGSSKKVALALKGGNATFGGDIILGGRILFGNGLALKLAVAPIISNVADGQSITYPNAGYLPVPTFSIGGLAPLNAGETYNMYLENQTASGATVRLKINVPGTPVSYNLTSDSAGGSGSPLRVVSKGDAFDSANNSYTITGTFSTNVTGTRISLQNGNTTTIVSVSLTISIYAMVSGSWSLVGIAVIGGSTYNANFPYTLVPNGNNNYTVSGTWSLTVSAPTGVTDFGANISRPADDTTQTGYTIPHITSVSWVSSPSASSVRTATPSGQTSQLTLTY